MKYVDIHTHILYNSDDGSESIEQSLEILTIAKKHHVNSICFTPHCFINNPPDMQEVIAKTNILKEKINNNINSNINNNINLFYGCEIMIEDTLPSFIKKNEEMCLGEGNYVLIELPMFNYPIYIKEVLYQTRLKGFIPIIAHPERNSHIQLETTKHIKDIIVNGYIQINAGSLTGRHGELAKKTALKLVKRNLVSFVASDSHNDKGYSHMDEAYNIYRELKGKEKTDQVFFYNPYKALKGEYIEQVEINYIKKKQKA